MRMKGVFPKVLHARAREGQAEYGGMKKGLFIPALIHKADSTLRSPVVIANTGTANLGEISEHFAPPANHRKRLKAGDRPLQTIARAPLSPL